MTTPNMRYEIHELGPDASPQALGHMAVINAANIVRSYAGVAPQISETLLQQHVGNDAWVDSKVRTFRGAAESPDHRLFVATLPDGTVAGYSGIELSSNRGLTLEVDQHHQRQGLGTALLYACFGAGDLTRHGTLQTVRGAEAAQFYRHHGFEPAPPAEQPLPETFPRLAGTSIGLPQELLVITPERAAETFQRLGRLVSPQIEIIASLPNRAHISA